MKLSELVEKLNLHNLTSSVPETEVTGCYIGDLLSRVMGKAQTGEVWITIMNNINIVAVAAMTDCACILLCEGVCVPPEIAERASAEGVTILSSEKSAYALAAEIAGLI